MDNASASSKRKQSNAKTGKEESAAKGDSSSEVAGSKRAREGENNTHPAPKKMVVTSNPKDASKSAQPPNMTPTAGLNGKAAANSAAPRPRPAAAAPKLSSLFGSLSSASKRPGTTNAERAAAAAAAAKTGYVFHCDILDHAYYFISTSALQIFYPCNQSLYSKILTNLIGKLQTRKRSKHPRLLNLHFL